MDASSLKFTWESEVRPDLREQLSAIWVTTTNAGGALGFLPPVTSADVAPTASATFARIDERIDDLLVAWLDDQPIGWLVLERDAREFAGHWRTVKRVQVHPDHQRSGFGAALVDEARRFATDELGLEFLFLTVRDGTGVSRLYERLGYREVGRVPGALRVAAGDDRDEVFMVRTLMRATNRGERSR